MAECWICFEESGLITVPCQCIGSMGYVHPNCLQRYMALKSTTQCPQCLTPYPTRIKYTFWWGRILVGLFYLGYHFILLWLTRKSLSYSGPAQVYTFAWNLILFFNIALIYLIVTRDTLRRRHVALVYGDVIV